MAIRFSSALARRDEARIARLLERGCPVDRPAELISTLGQPVPPEILAEVRVQGDRALAMTIPFNHPDYKGSICLVYGLILSGSQWLIYDIEVQDPETAALALSAIDAPIPPPATQASEAARRSLHSVSGTVFEPAQEPSQELLERMAAAGSQEEFDKIMKSVPEPKPLAGVAVRLEGKVSKFTVSDAQGHYRFDLLLRGSYRVRAERPSSPPARNAVAWASVDLHEHQNRFVDLRLSTGLVSAKGKIKDARGRPVAGAKVTAIEVEDPTIQYEGDNFQPAICSTISAADGSYEIKDLEPANWFRILPYLAKGKPDEPARFDGRAIRCVDIHVSAPGLSQPANAMPRVPCLTEEHVQLARGFFKAYGQMAARAGLPAPPQAQEGLDFPPSIGHTMLVEDIALQPGESGGR